MGGPEDGVEDEFSLIVLAPAFMVVATGEAEAATAGGALEGPGDGLGFFGGDFSADSGVAFVRAIFA